MPSFSKAVKQNKEYLEIIEFSLMYKEVLNIKTHHFYLYLILNRMKSYITECTIIKQQTEINRNNLYLISLHVNSCFTVGRKLEKYPLC